MIALTRVFPSEDTELAVRAEGVYKKYGSEATAAPVLRGADLTVRQGQCAFLVGPSGSGKTTLLSILGCILSADRGRVRILDQDLGAMDRRHRVAMRRDRIGFVFQRFYLIRGLTALDNVCVPLTLRAVPRQTARRRALEMLEAVGLADKAHAHPARLSAGQCQRVALARALVGDPELILADEPTASLDAASGQEVMKLLRKLTTEQGKTAIVVTHDQRIFHFADCLFRLENGRIVQSGKPKAESGKRKAESGKLKAESGATCIKGLT